MAYSMKSGHWTVTVHKGTVHKGTVHKGTVHKGNLLWTVTHNCIDDAIPQGWTRFSGEPDWSPILTLGCRISEDIYYYTHQ